MCILKLLPFQGVWGVASAFQGVWGIASAFQDAWGVAFAFLHCLCYFFLVQKLLEN